MTTREELMKQVTEVGEELNKSISDIQTEVNQLKTSGTLAADQVEKLESMKTEVGESAKALSEASEKLQALEKRLDEQEALAQKLKSQGAAGTSGDADYRKAAAHLAEMRAELSGAKTHLFGDESDENLPSADEVLRHETAFLRYASQSKSKELGQVNMPEETLAVGSSLFNPSFGIAIPASMTGRMIGELYEFGSLRGLALERTVGSGSVKLMRFSGKVGLAVGNENVSWDAGDLPKGYDVSYPVVDWVATISLNRDTVEDAQFGLVDFLSNEARSAYGEKEAEYHITGDGVQKPTGILTIPTTDVSVGSLTKRETDFTKVTTVKSGVSAKLGHDTATNASYGLNPLIKMVNSLHNRYRTGATFLMNRLTFSEVVQMRDTDGNYYVNPLTMAGAPGNLRILGYPVRINDNMPDLAANSLSVAVGDWSQAYEIADRRGVFMLVDPYSNKPNIEYSFHWRSGGRPADTRAYRLLKAAA